MVLIFYMKLYVFYWSSFGHFTDLLDLMVIFGLRGPMPLVQLTRTKIIKNCELIEFNILNLLLALWQ